MNKEKINIKLSKDEAIVLFEWISSVDFDSFKGIFNDDSERKVLFDILSNLEDVLTEPFLENYKKLLKESRRRLNTLS